ncbi:MAG: SEC-C domain-containing protein, partial [Burkholderiales bacterium]|nr:SEC-C domain-containing protein [Burkholderiales bacterium]
RAEATGRDVFCSAYRALFDHARERLQRMADALRRRNLASFARSGAPWPERNERCFCGSGRKFKQCCAAMRDAG